MADAVRLLVRADDAGSSWAANMGCLRACTEGIARSVEVMVPGGWLAHAAALFNARPEIDVGIHLTLTSEWDAVKWRPLTAAPSLVDARGDFLPLLTPRPGDERPSLQDRAWSIEEVAAEFRAQIALGMATLRNVTHVSSHMVSHFSSFDPRLGAVVSDLCAEFGLCDDPLGQGMVRLPGYPKYPLAAEARVAAFSAALDGLTPGTAVFVDHPAVAGGDLEALGHPGYRDVAADRRSCLEVLTSPILRREIERRGIAVIGYRDL